MSNLTIFKMALLAALVMFVNADTNVHVDASDMKMEKMDKMEMTDKVEDSTVSPIADMAIIDAEMKTSTERPPVMEAPKPEEKPKPQRHTVADFIIHPLIAFKPRNPEDDGTATAAGKQSNNGSNGGTTTTTTPSPWQLFGFNAGQGLGSQVTNLAGQVTGWLNDRIQFPGIVETPVRESTTTSTSTTTTERPDVVVRVQHKASTRRPLISINTKRPNIPQFESDENEDDDDEDNEDNNEEQDEDSEGNASDEGSEDDNENSSNEAQENNSSVEEDDDQKKDDKENSNEEQDEETVSQRPNNKRRPLRKNNNKNRNGQRRRIRPQQQQQQQSNRRRTPSRRQHQAAPPQRRRPAVAENEVSDEDVQDDDEYVNNESDDFYFSTRPSTKRSQSSQSFIRRGQQQLINQIRQFTRAQTPAEIGAAINKAQRGSSANNKRRQHATLYVNRNGQTIYVAPEFAAPQYQQIYAQPVVQKPMTGNAYPQPPLTVPLKRKGQPTQYITIPWSKLGISPPNNIVSITEGIQGKPLILNIPQSAINMMQSQAASHSRPKKKRPQLITADAVPLLAEASLMDILKPPQIPPSRTTSGVKPMTTTGGIANVAPVIVASKPSSAKASTPLTHFSTPLIHNRIRAGTIIENAPETEEMKTAVESESKTEGGVKIDLLRATADKEFILVGDDNEPGLTRQVEPAFGDARFVRLTGNSQFYDVLPRRRFTVRRGGRDLIQDTKMTNMANSDKKTEQLIPVQIVSEPEADAQVPSKSEGAISENTKIDTPAMDAILSDPKPMPAPMPESMPMQVEKNTKQTTDAMMTT